LPSQPGKSRAVRAASRAHGITRADEGVAKCSQNHDPARFAARASI